MMQTAIFMVATETRSSQRRFYATESQSHRVETAGTHASGLPAVAGATKISEGGPRSHRAHKAGAIDGGRTPAWPARLGAPMAVAPADRLDRAGRPSTVLRASRANVQGRRRRPWRDRGYAAGRSSTWTALCALWLCDQVALCALSLAAQGDFATGSAVRRRPSGYGETSRRSAPELTARGGGWLCGLVPWKRDELYKSRSAAPGSQGATTAHIRHM